MSATGVRRTYGVERLGALSDGVFAIVLTLLVLELKLPEISKDTLAAEERALVSALVDQVPQFVAWIISFVLVARFWVAHHAIVASLARCHAGTMAWNFIVLGVVSLVPFGASLIGNYELDPIAVGIFSAIFGVSGITLGLFARHAARETQLRQDGEVADLQFHWKYHALILPIVAVVAGLGILIDEVVALLVWAMEPLLALWTAFRHRLHSKKGD